MQPRFDPIIVDAPQLSPQWFTARIGNLTGSKVKDAIAYDTRSATKGKLAMAAEFYDLNRKKFSVEYEEELRKYPTEYCLKAGIEVTPTSTRQTYKKQVVGERISGVSADENLFITRAMMWGQEQERSAKYRYIEFSGNKAEDSPLFMHPQLMCGASPDGLVIDIQTGELGNLECKSLEFWNHLYNIIMPDEMPPLFKPQVQMQMWINNRDWCDFVGYDPRVKEGLQLFVQRIKRDDFYIYEVLVPGVVRFLDECDTDERKFYAIMKKRGEEARDKYLAGNVAQD